MNKETSIKLYFDEGGLYRVAFSHPLLNSEQVAVRGKTGSYYNDYLSFQWTSAVRGLALLLAKTKLAAMAPALLTNGVLDGGQGTLAASLDYALNKKPDWLMQMFGADKRGRPLALRFIQRQNPLRKRGSKVALSVSAAVLPPRNILIQVRGHEADEVALKSLYDSLCSGGGSRNASGSYKALSTFPGVLAEEVRLSLAANDIFSEPMLHNTLDKFAKSRTFQKLSGGAESLSNIDRNLSHAERLGLARYDKGLLRRTPLSVAVAIGHVANQALMVALQELDKVSLEIDYTPSSSTELVRTHLKGAPLPPLICLSLAPSAKLIGLGRKSSYFPLMMLPSQRVSLIERRTEKGPNPKGLEYFLLTGDSSTGQMVYDQLLCRKLLPEKHVIRHVEAHELFPALRSSRFTCRSLLGFPYNYFSAELLPQAQFLDLPPDLIWKETFLFAHNDLLKQPELLRALDIALRNAWLTLLDDTRFRARVARQLGSLPGYMSTLKRQSGILMR